MIVVDQYMLDQYAKDDRVLSLLGENCAGDDAAFTSHTWLVDSPPKRLIYWYLYADLFDPARQPLAILDVGGGYSSLTRLMRRHRYTLLDIMVHDSHDSVRGLEQSFGERFWVNSDWYRFEVEEPYDLVIANDLFPNVDQRLELFLKKFLPASREIRLSLSYYNSSRFYQVKRLDADEIFCMLAWDGQQTRSVLEKFADRIEVARLDILSGTQPSLFANRRQVCMVTIRGDLGDDG